MTKLYDSQITQILPDYLSDGASAQALSFALGRAVEKLIGYCGNIGVFAVIDTAPDYVLDRIALELNTQYYSDSLDIKTKRSLVKNTINWYGTAGTPAAVEELVASVFGRGEVQEWFQYGGEPYMFKISTNADADYDSIVKFDRLIERVKNIRSHIDKVSFLREQENRIYMAFANVVTNRVTVGWGEPDGNL